MESRKGRKKFLSSRKGTWADLAIGFPALKRWAILNFQTLPKPGGRLSRRAFRVLDEHPRANVAPRRLRRLIQPGPEGA